MTVAVGDPIRARSMEGRQEVWRSGWVTLVVPQPEWCPHLGHVTVFYKDAQGRTRIAYAMDVESRRDEVAKWREQNEISGRER